LRQRFRQADAVGELIDRQTGINAFAGFCHHVADGFAVVG
jgi:hypothetical protein